MLFPTLPPDARLWIFTADRSLSESDQDHLRDTLVGFVAQWTSHGRSVPGDVALTEDRFVLVAAHLAGGVSGCGIDSLVHAVEQAGSAIGIQWVDGLHIVFRDEAGAVEVLPRPAFRQRVRDGAVTAETPAFVTTLDTVGALREGGLARPAGSTWHGRTFRIPEPA
ncbi:MAG: hypothetical protein ABJF88_15155 [Rhodothermales bacterium]